MYFPMVTQFNDYEMNILKNVKGKFINNIYIINSLFDKPNKLTKTGEIFILELKNKIIILRTVITGVLYSDETEKLFVEEVLDTDFDLWRKTVDPCKRKFKDEYLIKIAMSDVLIDVCVNREQIVTKDRDIVRDINRDLLLTFTFYSGKIWAINTTEAIPEFIYVYEISGSEFNKQVKERKGIGESQDVIRLFGKWNPNDSLDGEILLKYERKDIHL